MSFRVQIARSHFKSREDVLESIARGQNRLFSVLNLTDTPAFRVAVHRSLKYATMFKDILSGPGYVKLYSDKQMLQAVLGDEHNIGYDNFEISRLIKASQRDRFTLLPDKFLPAEYLTVFIPKAKPPRNVQRIHDAIVQACKGGLYSKILKRFMRNSNYFFAVKKQSNLPILFGDIYLFFLAYITTNFCSLLFFVIYSMYIHYTNGSIVIRNDITTQY